MKYSLLSDIEIMNDLAVKIDLLRRKKFIKDEELAAHGGTSRAVLSQFRKGHSGISLRSFIRILRGINELDRLESCFSITEHYSPTGKAYTIPKKRIRAKKGIDFRWGEDT